MFQDLGDYISEHNVFITYKNEGQSDENKTQVAIKTNYL